ncbi:MAG: PAS domain S-box protein [Candidatus Heimdallarchaeota archaeon]
MNAKTKGEELTSERSYKTNPVLEQILSHGNWYKTLVETMADGIVASDMNHNIVFVNSRICKLLEYEKEELLGQNANIFIAEQDRPRVIRETEIRYKEKKTSQYEVTLRTKLGSKIAVLISGTPIMDSKGQTIGTYALITDIRDRKVVEKELRTKNVELQSLYNNLLELYEQLAVIIAETIQIHTEILLFTSKNCVYCAPAEEVLQEVLSSYGGKITYRKVDVEEEPELADKFDIMSLPTIAIGEEKLTSVPDIYKLHSALFSALVPEEKFRRTRQELDNIINYSPIAILTISDKGIVTSVNPLVEVMTGFKRKDIIGKDIFEKKVKVFNSEMKKLFRRGLKGETISVNRLQLKKFASESPGLFSIVSLKVVPMASKEGDITEILAISEDVTLIALQEQEITNSYQKLEELNDQLLEMNKERTNFIDMTSTRLIEPLRNSKGLLDSILSGETGELNEELFGTIEYLRNNLQNVTKSIMAILEFSSIEAKDFTLKTKQYQLMDIVSQAFQVVGSMGLNKGFFTTYDVPEDIKVWCDSEQVIRIIKNLLVNAIQFTPQDCQIKITAKKLKKGLVSMSIADNGIGLLKKDLKRIFEQYIKLDTYSPGSGLGLSVVKSLVEAHGGKIKAESEGKDKGTTFTFTLPATKSVYQKLIEPKEKSSS